jgi:DNA modification methylase
MPKLEKLEWKTEKRRVNDLLPYEKNPRKITDTQMEGLKESLKKFNLSEIPACNTDGKIVAGHQRVKALQLLGRGEEMIEVRIPNRKLTANEFKEYLLTSNRSGGSWDWEILASDFDIDTLLIAGFDSTDLTNIFDDNLEVTDDNFDEEKELGNIKETDIKTGDIFQLGRHRLTCGNSQDDEVIAKLMDGKFADMINTDPPYNIGLSYNKGVGNKANYGGTTNDNKSESEYEAFLNTLIHNGLNVSKPDTHIFFWCDERYVGLLQHLYRAQGIDSKRLCIWVKSSANPTPGVAFNKVTEYCVYGTRGKPYLSDKVKNLHEILNKEMTTGNRLTEDIMDMLNIWLVKRLPSQEYAHPTQKPPTLHEKALRRCSRPGDIVLDLTGGSGSILSACEQLKRTAYVCEMEPIFCQLIINRFKQLSPNEKVTKLN